MNEQQALAKMVAPGTRRPGKYMEGVIQIWVTRACDKACFGCTQGSNLGGSPGLISIEQFEQACLSLKDYFGVVGVFGGNPATHPQFETLCQILRRVIPYERRGLWCNNPMTIDKAIAMRNTFNPAVSNINVHLDAKAYDLFKRGWPESMPFGLTQDCRHSPPFVAMKDVLKKVCNYCVMGFLPGEEAVRCPECDGTGKVYDESKAWDLISDCDINKHWSAMIGVFRGQLRAWFCEVAGAQAMLHQEEPDYPDTGRELWFEPEENLHGELKPCPIKLPWWIHSMASFSKQVRKHCHDCGVPLRGYGELSQEVEGVEQTTKTHEAVYKPKRKDRPVEIVSTVEQLIQGRITRTTDYMGNARR